MVASCGWEQSHKNFTESRSVSTYVHANTGREREGPTDVAIGVLSSAFGAAERGGLIKG